jgi:hypothetical protein
MWVWRICENFRGSTEMIEKDHAFLVLNTVKLCVSLDSWTLYTNDRKHFFQTNDPIAGFDGLNMFCE